MPDDTRPTLKCAKLLFDNSSNFQDVIRSCPMSSGNSKSGPRPLMFGNTDREPSVGMFDPLKTCSPIRPASPDLPLCVTSAPQSYVRLPGSGPRDLRRLLLLRLLLEHVLQRLQVCPQQDPPEVPPARRAPRRGTPTVP